MSRSPPKVYIVSCCLSAYVRCLLCGIDIIYSCMSRQHFWSLYPLHSQLTTYDLWLTNPYILSPYYYFQDSIPRCITNFPNFFPSNIFKVLNSCYEIAVPRLHHSLAHVNFCPQLTVSYQVIPRRDSVTQRRWAASIQPGIISCILECETNLENSA